MSDKKKKGNTYMRLDTDLDLPSIAIPTEEYDEYRLHELNAAIRALKKSITEKNALLTSLVMERAKLEDRRGKEDGMD